MADDLPPGFSVVSGPAAANDDLPSGFSVVQPAPEHPSTVMDVLKSAGSGVVRGAVETAMLPVTAKRALDKYATPYEVSGINLIRSIFGAAPMTTSDVNDLPAADRAINSGQDKAREMMDAVLHSPQTTPGKFAETIGEFAAPGGLPSKATRAAPTLARKAGEYAADLTANAAVPGALSEAGGQATEGTALEPYARLIGAITGNAGMTAGRAYYAPDMQIRRATEGMTDAQWQRAKELQDNSTGVRLSGPEAVAQATEGASALPDVLRVVEGSVTGRQKTAPFFAARPGQVDTAVGGMLDKIAPQSPQPSTLGPRAAQAADDVVNGVRQDINAQTRPLYQAAEPNTLLPQDFAPIAADPRFQAALKRLRDNAELAPDYASLPDDSIAVVDAVTKDMAARGEALSNSANALYGPELAGKSAAGAKNARTIARNASPEYDQALTQQENLRRTQLEPIEQGPIGRVAAAGTTEGAGNAILPQNPLTGSAGETADAVARLVAKDPEAVTGLIRQRLADIYSKASTATRENNREFSGANFNKAVAGNPARREVLDAVLRSIPNGQAAAVAPELLDVLAATGRRSGVGSRTAFNTAINAELGTASPVGRAVDIAKTLGGSFLTQAGDAARRATLRGSLGKLADLFTDPQSVDLLRQSVLRGAPTVWPEALGRTGLELGAILNGGGSRQ